ncbi:MAG: outer membrane beta-barrel domain-containing protein [Polyangiales bacterium]
MNTASRWLFALGLVVSSTTASLVTSSASAQEVQVKGPLAGAPAVRHMRVYRDGRFQLQPEFSSTLVDEFSRTLFVGAQIGYHFTDWLGIHGFFDYGISLDTDLTDQIKRNGQRTDTNALSLPSPAGFGSQIGELKFLTGVQATFIPLRGKLALFQALFIDTDFYLFAGVAFASVKERANVSGGVCSPDSLRTARDNSPAAFNSANNDCLDTQGQSSTRLAIAPTFGVGLSLYMTDYLALTLEYRAFPFKWNTSGTDEGGQNRRREESSGGPFPDGEIDENDRTKQFNQSFRLGFAFYFPVHGEITK